MVGKGKNKTGGPGIESGSGVAKDEFLIDYLASHLEMKMEDELVLEMEGKLFAKTRDGNDFLVFEEMGVTRKTFGG